MIVRAYLIIAHCVSETVTVLNTPAAPVIGGAIEASVHLKELYIVICAVAGPPVGLLPRGLRDISRGIMVASADVEKSTMAAANV
jgi:hypothetical protein